MKNKAQLTSYQQFIQQFQCKDSLSSPIPTQQTRKVMQLNKSTKSHNQSQNQMHSQSYTAQKNSNKKNTRSTQKTTQMKQQINHSYHSYNKFITQLTSILTNITNLKGTELLTHKISYIQYLETMKSLKMIHQSYQPYPGDIVSQLWNQFVSQNNIGNFVGIICGVLKYTTEGSTNITLDGYLNQKYSQLRMTRLQLNGLHSCEKSLQNSYTFKPQINKKSQELLLTRNKENEKQQKYHYHYHPDCIKRNKTDRSHQKQYQDKYQFSKELQTKKCYQFYKHPQTQRESQIKKSQYSNQSSQVKKNLQQSNQLKKIDKLSQLKKNQQLLINELKNSKKDISGNRRSQLLYKLSKSIQKKQDKSSIDIQYQKNIKQLTFKPKIKKQKSLQKNIKKVKGQSIIINRMIKGRVQRQLKRIINDKGTTYNQKIIDKMRKDKYRDIYIKFKQDNEGEVKKYKQEQHEQQLKQPTTPQQGQTKPIKKDIIVVNIFIEQDRSQQLIYHRGQQTIIQAAQKFIKEHNLGNKEKQKLIKQLENVLKFSLCSIQEQEEQSQDQKEQQQP